MRSTSSRFASAMCATQVKIRSTINSSQVGARKSGASGRWFSLASSLPGVAMTAPIGGPGADMILAWAGSLEGAVNVRFGPIADIRTNLVCWLIDDFVGAGEHSRWEF